jgi:proliferating cell nuclear antigen
MALSVSFYTKPFRDLIESIKDVVPTVVFSFAEDGLDMQSMDVNKVALVEFFIPSDSFTRYDYPDEEDFDEINADEDDRESVSFALDLKSLSKILKCVKADSECEFIYELNGDIVSMEFSNNSESFCFDLKLMDMESSRLPIPERENNVSMTFPSDLYQSFTKDIATLATDIVINVGEFNASDDNDDESADGRAALKFEFNSDLGNGSWTVQFMNGIELHSFNEEVSQRFSMHYLQNFAKAVLNAGRADIALKSGEPIEIVCPLPKFSQCSILPSEDNDEDVYPNGYIKFFLAPRVEEN